MATLILQMTLFLINQNTKPLKNFFHLDIVKNFRKDLQPFNFRKKNQIEKRWLTSHLVSPLPGRIFPYEQSIETIDFFKKYLLTLKKKISNNLRKKILLRSTREFSELKEGNGMQINILIILKKNRLIMGSMIILKTLETPE